MAAQTPFLTPRRVTAGVLALGAVGVTAAAVTLYVQREAIGVRLAFDYLRAHGVPAEIRLDRLDLGGVSGALRLGPRGRPDLTVGRVEAEFGALPAPWGGVRAPPLRALRLMQPVLHARWRDGRLDFGSLQPLVDQALHAKPGGGPAPDLSIQDGRLELETPAGLITVALDAVLEQGRVRSFHARLQPTDLDVLGVRLAQVQGVLRGQATGLGGLHLVLAFGAAHGQASTHGADNRAAGLTLTGEALAPNGAAGLTTGAERPLDAVFRLQAARFALQPDRGPVVAIHDADLTLDLDGAVDRRGVFAGKLHARGRAGKLARAGLEIASATMALASTQARAQAGGTGLTAEGPFTLALDASEGRLSTAALKAALAPASLQAAGRLSIARTVSVQAQGTLRGGASLPKAEAVRLARRVLGDIDPVAADAAARALQQVSVAIPSYALAFDSRRGATLRLDRGATVQAPGGGVTLRPVAGAPMLHTGGAMRAASGGFALGVHVKDLPQLDLGPSRYSLASDGAVLLKTSLSAQGSLGPARDAALRFTGQAQGRGRDWAVTGADCARVAVGALRSGAKVQASGVRAEVCPQAGQPLLALASGRWRVRAGLRGLGAALPSAELKAQVASIDVALDSAPRGPAGRIVIQGAAVQDTATMTRLRPVTASGVLDFTEGSVHGPIALVLAKGGAALGVLNLRARLQGSDGDAVLDTGRLNFAPKGLQPGDIVPAAAQALPEAQGSAELVGRFAWSPAGVTSSGEVRTDGFSFKTPAGKIDGLRGDVRLTSLSPLVSAPDQSLAADRLEMLVPLNSLQARFTLAPDHLALQDATAQLSGGQASLGPMRLPIGPGGGPISGVLTLKGVDLDRLIGVLNLSNAVSLQARVSGALPFALQPTTQGGVALRLANGRIAADGPGRLTIRRQALTGSVATAGADGAQPNAVQDFAYQALENLAFTQLDASVASRPGGRLGVVFHVVGRHDPAVDKPTRIGLFALLRGHAFDKPLPLPKGTPVELTLDTSLNLDDILAAYGQLGGARSAAPGSAKVQP